MKNSKVRFYDIRRDTLERNICWVTWMHPLVSPLTVADEIDRMVYNQKGKYRATAVYRDVPVYIPTIGECAGNKIRVLMSNGNFSSMQDALKCMVGALYLDK